MNYGLSYILENVKMILADLNMYFQENKKKMK